METADTVAALSPATDAVALQGNPVQPTVAVGYSYEREGSMCRGSLQVPSTLLRFASDVCGALQEKHILAEGDRLLGELRELMTTMPEKGEFQLDDYGNHSSVAVHLPPPEKPTGNALPLYDVYCAVQRDGQPDRIDRFRAAVDGVQAEVHRRLRDIVAGLNGQVHTLLSALPALRERTDVVFSLPDGMVRIAVSLHGRVLRDFYAGMSQALEMGPLVHGQVWRSVR